MASKLIFLVLVFALILQFTSAQWGMGYRRRMMMGGMGYPGMGYGGMGMGGYPGMGYGGMMGQGMGMGGMMGQGMGMFPGMMGMMG